MKFIVAATVDTHAACVFVSQLIELDANGERRTKKADRNGRKYLHSAREKRVFFCPVERLVNTMLVLVSNVACEAAKEREKT